MLLKNSINLNESFVYFSRFFNFFFLLNRTFKYAFKIHKSWGNCGEMIGGIVGNVWWEFFCNNSISDLNSSDYCELTLSLIQSHHYIEMKKETSTMIIYHNMAGSTGLFFNGFSGKFLFTSFS